MARTDEKVRYAPEGKPFDYTPQTAALSAQNVIRVLEGRWKLVILFQLFGSNVRRFSELEKAIPGVSQKMLIQQLRQLEADGVVARIVHPQVPPKVEYHLTEWGQSLCPVLDKLLSWAEAAPADVRDRLIESDRSAANAQG
ncbi:MULTISPECIES: winged helix-turn-helix transcriptional regulator [Brevundimonas]|uniref:DNA-binding HxlR family transcriptional regulator n=1 Tax=Brevundimonas mediterranea TaxID=74329 RepID=A0A7W6A2N8_9CAUL|nr:MULTISPECIES: winged helix-turn-helix transcriptional regulator [Brevundimonas]MBB3872163.1 DNA-binding HxlR family transcriptional regulator [Brevundimonas mediterranea]MCG2664670.1 winged helix-turn-helix transcriptional regulator [Brevundimonas sp.]OGN48524.1 MAG: transcriptional regulator [Caulobacterales bacterium RIFCSPHIGHO2_12_FULL_68_13]OGN49778.1 MAG: transcriptional regulator [Caulobacterales bacterium RIFCSPHIGHO2_01_FULL_67_30]